MQQRVARLVFHEDNQIRLPSIVQALVLSVGLLQAAEGMVMTPLSSTVIFPVAAGSFAATAGVPGVDALSLTSARR
jgi:hypothetical protein